MSLDSRARIILIGGLTLLLVLAFVSHLNEIQAEVTSRDSIAYWAAGYLLAHHQNPYDSQAVLALERSYGYSNPKPLVLRTPPWSLFLTVPLGFLNPLWAWVTWLTGSLISLILAMRMCLSFYSHGETAAARNLFFVIGYTFAPVPACLVAGQMGLVLLLGLMLFLLWEKRRPLLAGMALLVPFSKPHLLSGFWVALLAYAIGRKDYRIFGGFLLGFALAVMVILPLDPGIFFHYRMMLQGAAIQSEFIPALSGVVRLLFFRELFWVQFVPMMFGVAWSLWYLKKNWSHWEWKQHGPPLLIISVLTTPYSWITDEVVVLPAILQAAAWIYQRRHDMGTGTRLLLAGFAFLDALLLLILRFKIPFSTGIYFWSSLVWLAWYFYARRYPRIRGSQ